MPDEKPPLDLEIHIDDNGDVVLTELPLELAEMVLELDPEHPLRCALPSSIQNEKPTE